MTAYSCCLQLLIRHVPCNLSSTILVSDVKGVRYPPVLIVLTVLTLPTVLKVLGHWGMYVTFVDCDCAYCGLGAGNVLFLGRY